MVCFLGNVVNLRILKCMILESYILEDFVFKVVFWFCVDKCFGNIKVIFWDILMISFLEVV